MVTQEEMTIEEACHAILGDETANAIIMDMGVHWAVVAATCEKTHRADPKAVARIKRYLEEEKRK